jgi:glycosyltransferase involved in cell wall biosynthesis
MRLLVGRKGRQRTKSWGFILEFEGGLTEILAVKVSTIVPAFNEEKLITTSLRHMRSASSAFQELGWETELIVCDNNSTDATAELALRAGAKVVFEPINQIARSRNRGASVADGEWLVFVDADSYPSRELFADVAQVIRDGRCLGGGCTVCLDEAHRIGQLVTGLWNLISRTIHWAAGSFVFCQTEAFRAVGGFSEELFASEELDLSRRLKKLAKDRSQQFRILHQHPLVTSARKMHLYSLREYLRFMARAVLRPRRAVRERESCLPWYDGRR